MKEHHLRRGLPRQLTRQITRWRALIVALVLVICAWSARGRGLRHASTSHEAASIEEPAAWGEAPVIMAASGPTQLSGNVTATDRRGVRGARVCASRVSVEPSAGVPTCVDADGAGRYALVGLPPGGYWITAEAERYFPGVADSGRVVTIAAGEVKTGLDIVLELGGAKLAGRVLDATGGPVPGATVRAMRTGPPHHMVAVASGPDGRFVLWVLPGSVTLSAEAIGYAPARISRVAPSSDVVLTLTPGSTVQGTVVAAKDGAPVPAVVVRAVPAGGWASALNRSGASDAQGAFSIAGLEPGAYTLVAEGDGWRGKANAPLQIGLAQSTDHVTVTVSPATLVAGKVVLRKSGEPCSSGSVTLGPTSPAMTSPYDSPSAAGEARVSAVPSMMAGIEPGGDVHFRSVPPGAYHVVVQCADRVLAEGPTMLDVGPAKVDGVVWKVEPGLGMVVHVTDEGGGVLPGARFVLLWPARAPSTTRAAMMLAVDTDGRYRVPGVLFPGVYTLQPGGGADGDPVDVDLREGTIDATLKLRGRGSILVTVRTPDGQMVDDVAVKAALASDPSADAGPRAAQSVSGVSLGDGRFRVGPLAQGRYRVEVADGVNAPAEADGASGGLVEVASGTVEATVTLDRGESLRGQIVDASGQPVPDTWVSASCRREGATDDPAAGTLALRGFGGSGRRVMSGPEGRFAIDGLAPREICTVRASQPYGPAGMTQGARPGDDVTITLSALGVLSAAKP